MRLSLIGFLWLSSISVNKVSLAATPECSLYLAPSSIVNAGFGIYTTRHIQSGKPVLSYEGSDSPSIQVTNSAQHNGGTEVSWSHVDYFWSASGINEFESAYVEESVMTMGALANYHTYLKNIKPYSLGYDDSVADRFHDPSAGAFSYYLGHAFKASKDIQPGEELFADYGESWLKTREGTFADHIPRSENYDRAATVLKTLQLESEKNSIQYSEAILTTVKNVVQILEPLAAAVLPTSVSDYHQITQALNQKQMEKGHMMRDLLSKAIAARNTGNAKNDTQVAHTHVMTSVATKLAQRTVNITQHSVEWVKQNGLCLENIVPRKSTIPHAGQGAFAARFLPKDSLITPAPLIQIPDRKSILTYDLIEAEDGKTLVRKNDTPIGSQLLLNYCFGHGESRLLLCPQTNVILINHCSSRKAGEGECGTKGPNAKIQWAGSWDPRSTEWLHKSLQEIDQLTAEGMRGLSFDVVATRDIHPGEEIFIDYGVEWEYAWEVHVRTWVEPLQTDFPWSYSQLTPFLQSVEPDIRTVEEQVTNPYPENIQTACYYDYSRDLVDSTLEGNEYRADGSSFTAPKDLVTSNSVYACEILEKGDDGSISVRILPLEDYIETPVVLTNYPESSITFRMRKRTSDQHLPGAFRHSIDIPDEIFPSQWKDAVVSSPKSEL